MPDPTSAVPACDDCVPVQRLQDELPSFVCSRPGCPGEQLVLLRQIAADVRAIRECLTAPGGA